MFRKFILFTTLALVIGGGSLQAAERLHDFFTLGIGVGDFKNKSLHPLNSPDGDVRQIITLFQRQDPFDAKKTLNRTHALYDWFATKKDIERELANLPNWVEEGATAVIVISTHGERLGGQWYFAPHDCDPNRIKETCVSGATLMQAIDTLIAKKHCRVMLVINACHAGEILVAAEPLLNKYRDPAQGGLILMAACIESQVSIETQTGAVFLSTLLSGLQDQLAHVQATSAVSLQEISRFVRSNLEHNMYSQIWKAPGVEWMEQNCVIEHSLSIPEDIGLTQADPNRVFHGDTTAAKATIGPPSGCKVLDTKTSPVGFWVCKRPLVATCNIFTGEPMSYAKNEKGELLQDIIVLHITANGQYEVCYRSADGRQETGSGELHFVPGKEFSLSYNTGADYFSLEKLDADHLTLRTASYLGGFRARATNTVFEFTRFMADKK